MLTNAMQLNDAEADPARRHAHRGAGDPADGLHPYHADALREPQQGRLRPLRLPHQVQLALFVVRFHRFLVKTQSNPCGSQLGGLETSGLHGFHGLTIR